MASVYPVFCGQIFKIDPYWRLFLRRHRLFVRFRQSASERFYHHVGRLFCRKRICPAPQFNSRDNNPVMNSPLAQSGKRLPIVGPKPDTDPVLGGQRVRQPAAHAYIPIVIHNPAEDFPFHLVAGYGHGFYLNKWANKRVNLCGQHVSSKKIKKNRNFPHIAQGDLSTGL